MNEIPWFKMNEDKSWEISYIPVQLSPGEEFIVEHLCYGTVKFKYKAKEGL